MIETRDDLLEQIAKLAEAWRRRGEQKALAALGTSWPSQPEMTSAQWADLLAALQRARTSAAGEITTQERATLDEAILLLEAWIYRC